MSIYQVLSLFSIPTLLVTLIFYVRYQIRAVKKGVQALLLIGITIRIKAMPQFMLGKTMKMFTSSTTHLAQTV